MTAHSKGLMRVKRVDVVKKIIRGGERLELSVPTRELVRWNFRLVWVMVEVRDISRPRDLWHTFMKTKALLNSRVYDFTT